MPTTRDAALITGANIPGSPETFLVAAEYYHLRLTVVEPTQTRSTGTG
jgi:hypothetical protein